MDNSVKSLKNQASKENRSPNEIKILTLTFPQVSQVKSNSEEYPEQSQRFPLTGTIEEIGRDIQRIKEMGVEHIMFAFVGLGLDKVIDPTKQLSRYAR